MVGVVVATRNTSRTIVPAEDRKQTKKQDEDQQIILDLVGQARLPPPGIMGLGIRPPFTEAEPAAEAAFRGVAPAWKGWRWGGVGGGCGGAWMQSSSGHNGATHSYPARLFRHDRETGAVMPTVSTRWHHNATH